MHLDQCLILPYDGSHFAFSRSNHPYSILRKKHSPEEQCILGQLHVWPSVLLDNLKDVGEQWRESNWDEEQRERYSPEWEAWLRWDWGAGGVLVERNVVFTGTWTNLVPASSSFIALELPNIPLSEMVVAQRMVKSLDIFHNTRDANAV